MLDLHAGEAPTIAFHDHAPELETFAAATVRGLSAAEKSIPCQFLYDERGSALFDRICELPEYYPTRTETLILRDHSAEIAARMGREAVLIELGSGSSIKVRILLEAMSDPAAYVAVDISAEHLKRAAQALAADYPELKVAAICADYSRAFALPDLPGGGRRVGFFPGSTIGNLERPDALAFLKLWAERLGPDAAMLVGVDLKKDAATLNAAYDDAQGVTAAFSLNLLARANRELGADFDLAAFRHRAVYDEAAGSVRIHLVSARRQTVRLAGRAFELAEGEAIHVENSNKYSLQDFADLAGEAGFTPATAWTDAKGLFSLHYLTTPPA